MLGEHLPCKQEVVGSIPTCSTREVVSEARLPNSRGGAGSVTGSMDSGPRRPLFPNESERAQLVCRNIYDKVSRFRIETSFAAGAT